MFPCAYGTIYYMQPEQQQISSPTGVVQCLSGPGMRHMIGVSFSSRVAGAILPAAVRAHLLPKHAGTHRRGDAVLEWHCHTGKQPVPLGQRLVLHCTLDTRPPKMWFADFFISVFGRPNIGPKFARCQRHQQKLTTTWGAGNPPIPLTGTPSSLRWNLGVWLPSPSAPPLGYSDTQPFFCNGHTTGSGRGAYEESWSMSRNHAVTRMDGGGCRLWGTGRVPEQGVNRYDAAVGARSDHETHSARRRMPSSDSTHSTKSVGVHYCRPLLCPHGKHVESKG